MMPFQDNASAAKLQQSSALASRQSTDVSASSSAPLSSHLSSASSPHASCSSSSSPPLVAGGGQASRDAWAVLRDEMGCQEMLYETSQRAKIYNRNHFGLLGILKVIRMTDPDLNVLALGTDLTGLGLNLNSPECLFASFVCPWELGTKLGAKAAEPEAFKPSMLPRCFFQNSPQLKVTHLQKVSEETLLYIFYNMPRDMLQAYAAAELYNRKWRYYPPTLQWFTRVGTDDRSLSGELKQATSATAAAVPEGTWVVFDTNAWKRREHIGPMNPALFLPSDQIRQTVEEATRSQLLQFVRTSSNDTGSIHERVAATVASATTSAAAVSGGGGVTSSSTAVVSNQVSSSPSLTDESAAALPESTTSQQSSLAPPPSSSSCSTSSSSSMALPSPPPPSYDNNNNATAPLSTVHTPPYTQQQVHPVTSSSAASSLLLQQAKAPSSMVYMYPQYPVSDTTASGSVGAHQQLPMGGGVGGQPQQQQQHLGGLGQQSSLGQQQQQPPPQQQAQWMTY
eukprot:GHVS01088960.1.p1 GENE.GHVS01088960.1~~GHVS01088960.1.p1  ORF type:complete len:510 (-),score=138.61 GHVS01088960.1:176-1705(-)